MVSIPKPKPKPYRFSFWFKLSFLKRAISITELRKIPDLLEGQKIKSFMIFNLKNEDKIEIFKSINLEFVDINKKLDKLREEEITELYNLRKPIFEKYEQLEKRYKDSERLDYVRELHSEFRNDNLKMLSESKTQSSYLKKGHQFTELKLTEYIAKKERFDFLNENMDFTNLINVNRENPNYLYYKLTEEEEEYETLKKYFDEYHSMQSLVTYCENYEPRLDKLLNSASLPSLNMVCSAITLSLVTPYFMEVVPEELLPTIPPIIQRLDVEVLGPKNKP